MQANAQRKRDFQNHFWHMPIFYSHPLAKTFKSDLSSITKGTGNYMQAL